LYEKQVSRRIGANHPGLARKAVHQLEQRLRGDILQWHDGDAIAWFGVGAGRVGAARSDRIADRGQTVAGGVANKHYTAEPQGIFEYEQNV
jgi:hypothetical protein